MQNDAPGFRKVFFWEDDIYCSDLAHVVRVMKDLSQVQTAFAGKNILSQKDSAAWSHWQQGENGREAVQALVDYSVKVIPYRSFNPFCVMSASLVREVLDFRSRYGRFVFHEILFPSLAMFRNEGVVDFNTSRAFYEHFRSVTFDKTWTNADLCSGRILHQCKPSQYLGH